MQNYMEILKRFERLYNIKCAVTNRILFEENELEKRFFDENMFASMDYLVTHRELKKNLNNVLPGVSSVISCAMPYHVPKEGPNPIAGYAWGKDYHIRLRNLLKLLAISLGLEHGTWRICVDSCPIPERTLGIYSGLGWVGKNGNLVVAGFGPNVVLGEILTTKFLESRDNIVFTRALDKCSSCSLCVNACPTGALLGNGLVDARKCLSFHTTESKEYPPKHIRDVLGPRVFGCDECVKACPYVYNSPKSEPLFDFETLPDAINLTNKDLKDTALSRLSMWRFLRNVALALRKHPNGEKARQQLRKHEHPQVRHAANEK